MLRSQEEGRRRGKRKRKGTKKGQVEDANCINAIYREMIYRMCVGCFRQSTKITS
jgi:hypothetical protein